MPAETLAQRGKLHRAQNRKQPINKHHQHHSETSSSPLNDAYAREILHQLQRQHDEKNAFLDKEMARQRQEAARKEHESMRLRDAEKKRKEQEKSDELARQRIRDQREREQQEERRLSELRTKQDDERVRGIDGFSTYRDGQLGEAAANQQLAGVQSQNYEVEHQQSQSFVPNSPFHQHLTEVTSSSSSKAVKSSKPRNKPREQLNQYQAEQQDFREVTEEAQTLPPPNQPPLSVFMGDNLSDRNRIRLTDVLKSLKSARTIAVLDNFGSDVPRVFVGPRHLEAPPGYAKFELPYLSSIENNRVERKVDKLPFFVAPLSFEPPPGYSKIPFPAPHIGSVVINSLENVEVKPSLVDDESLNPLIEPNAYQVVSNSPLPTYDVSTPTAYTAGESVTPRYELSSSLPPSQSTTKWRFQEFYENKPSTESSVAAAVTAATYESDRIPTSKTRNYYSLNEVSTTPSYYSPKTISSFGYESIPQSTPVYHQESTRQHNVDLLDQNVNRHRTRFPDPVPTSQQRYPIDPTGHTVTNTYYLNQSPNYEDPSQYNLPAELPAISPQLPGLVNALVEKTAGLSSSVQPPPTVSPTSTTTSTTTTTTETPTTTYRSRTRAR